MKIALPTIAAASGPSGPCERAIELLILADLVTAGGLAELRPECCESRGRQSVLSPAGRDVEGSSVAAERVLDCLYASGLRKSQGFNCTSALEWSQHISHVLGYARRPGANSPTVPSGVSSRDSSARIVAPPVLVVCLSS